MDKKICPECQKEIPADAKVCPSCACFFDNMDKQPPSNIQDDDDTKICPLTDNDATKKKKTYIALAGVCCIVVGFLLLEVVAIGSILLLGVGLYLLFYSSTINTDIQRGLCPYCREELVVKQKQTQISFFCPSCKKLVVQTPTTLEALEIDGEAIVSDGTDSKPDFNKIALDKIGQDFAELGWNTWDPSVHHRYGQLDRLRRAVDESDLHLVWYNEHTGHAKIKGSSGQYYLLNQYRCSCGDFRNRAMPCKHMYYLAIAIPDYRNQLFQDAVKNEELFEDTKLWGLHFYVAGETTDNARKLIGKHGGVCESFSSETTSAVVCSDTSSYAINASSLAQLNNIEVLSVDELTDMLFPEATASSETQSVQNASAIAEEPHLTFKVEIHSDTRSSNKPWASDIDLQQVCDQFAALGWDLWDSSIHYAQGQADRVKRGRTEGIVLIWYNQRTGYAKVKNARGRYYLVSRAGCSCPDFRDRGLPCKHMYFLASCLPDFGDKLVPDLVQKPPAGSESLLLYDLQFCLCGRGQDPIKEFLTLHGSRFGPYSWHDTDAVIVTDPTLRTATVTKAEEQNVAVISFDELKEMVCFEREEVAEVMEVDLENCGQVDG